jgi:hypothetical protein
MSEGLPAPSSEDGHACNVMALVHYLVGNPCPLMRIQETAKKLAFVKSRPSPVPPRVGKRPGV